mmetsp:Transcript_17723/g.37230  ORF Transcript_17723/g.37230 Transcript_17723/m.37230 type:complete len:519 (+) Transcript_17723:108-1664(+)|eukprot:CAMPEP_0171328976 /NCGR_PEP_ID=MMETSP0878-20121228/951_1 /TAXON_ID=67004 /ORGANISM="Thalassiosira weissflogii, Strain CCMP1336" /LENGTH=518 /DNA_ID=CAMNT_0011828863 /DNA_START=57 /DNA_END=1613 /DNA_ORIENTATION=+
MLFVLRRPAYISIFIVFVARLYLAIGYTFTSPASTSAAVRSRVITPSAFGIRASLFSTACSDISTWGRWPRRRQVVDRSKSRLSSSFYDDFEDFGEIGATSSENSNPADKGKAEDAPLDSGKNGNSLSNSDDDDVLRSLRARLNDLSTQKDEEDDYDEDEDDDDADDIDDTESESALPDLGGNSISSIDDLIGFAQAKASEERQDGKKEWARPIPVEDEESGKVLDFNELLDGGVVLVANPAKFCEDLEDVGLKGEESGEGRFNIGSLLDPFPVSKSSQSSRNGVSPELLAKFGLTIPPPADLGPDRRADLMPVLLITGKDSKGYRAVILNRRTGYLIGDMERQDAIQMDDDDDDDDEGDSNPPPPKPRLGAFMIQPLWYGGAGDDSDDNESGGGLEMLHYCPLVKGCTKLPKSDGLFWGGDPEQAQEVMKDKSFEEPLSGFSFKFFISYTKWSAAELEKEIKNGTWYMTTVSREVLFKSRDRLGSKRAKPLWTEVMDLLGEDYKQIRNNLYDDEDSF